MTKNAVKKITIVVIIIALIAVFKIFSLAGSDPFLRSPRGIPDRCQEASGMV